MFDNNNNIFYYSYDIQLDSIVKAICDISFDIGKQIEEFLDLKKPGNGFTIEDLFKESFISELGIRAERLSDFIAEDGSVITGYSNDEFFAIIADYYNKKLPYLNEFLETLQTSDILLLDKIQSTYLSKGDKAKERLIPALKNAKILKDIVSNINSEKIRNSLEKIELFENDVFYRNAITVTKQESQPLVSFIPLDFLNKELITLKAVDSDDYWINVNQYLKQGLNFKDVEEYLLVIDLSNQRELGLLVGDVVLASPNIDFVLLLYADKIEAYFWYLLTNTYAVKPQKENSKADQSIEEFKLERENVELNQLLSYLKNNLFIDDGNVINADFLKFFNNVLLLDKLEFLDEYQFMMSSSIEDETALGVYSTIKKGTSYNLLHWFNHQGSDNISHYRNPHPTNKNKKIIYTLKPPICYYFLEKYFEDLFENILSKNSLEYIANNNLFERGQLLAEVDFLVKSKKKLVYFETKTKLSKFYIEDFLKKSSKMIDRFGPLLQQGIEVEFCLVGAYSDSNVKDFQFFIDENKDKIADGYNISREGLNTFPYYFKMPIPDKEGRYITCIAEPEFKRLEKLVLEICQ